LPPQVLPPSASRVPQLSEFASGVRGVAPLLLGVVPFGLIYGVLAISAGLSPAAAQAMSAIVFAGSAQVVGVQLFRIGTPGAIIVLTTFVVNLRHVLYSASLAPYLKHLSWRWKSLLAYLLTDEAYAVAITRYNQAGESPPLPADLHWYFLGAGLGLWLTWQASTAAGLVVGAQIPPAWALDFTLALTFIALVVPALKDRPSIAAALTAGIVAVAAGGLPYRLGLLAAALCGIVTGLLLETLQAPTRGTEQEGAP
jgi:4-azaleucine resistance transporter AzlC